MKLNFLEIREDMKMDLNEFLKEHGAAKRLADTAAAIEFGSDGAIKMESLLEDQHDRTIAGFIRANVSK